MHTRRALLRSASFAAIAAATASVTTGLPARAQTSEPIKIGILHSLSGTMAISETTLKDVMLMLVDEQNKKGGVLGRKIAGRRRRPGQQLAALRRKGARAHHRRQGRGRVRLLDLVSRKSVLPVFEETNNILFYPVQYEGEESSKNVFYTGAAPNQQAIPAVDYLMKEESVQRWVLAGTDYVYPRTTNKILEAYLKAKGVKPEDIMINYTPFGQSDWQTIVADIKKFGSAGKKTAVCQHDQRRRQRAVLQGARQPGHQGDRHPGRGVQRRRGRTGRHRHQAAGRPPRRLELLHERRQPRQQGVHPALAGVHQEPEARRPTTRWRRTTSASTCG